MTTETVSKTFQRFTCDRCGESYDKEVVPGSEPSEQITLTIPEHTVLFHGLLDPVRMELCFDCLSGLVRFMTELKGKKFGGR